MNKDQVVDGIQKLESAISILSSNNTDTKLAKDIINKKLRQLKYELEEIQCKEETKLHVKVINGNKVEIPSGMNYGDRYKFYYEGNHLYTIEKGKLDSDGIFHYHGNVWINESKRCVKVMTRILGNDNYGDRVFSEARYYHDNKSSTSYHSERSVRMNGKYKEYIHRIIELIKKENGLTNFNPRE